MNTFHNGTRKSRITSFAASVCLIGAMAGVGTMGGCNNAGEGALSGAALGALGGLAIGSLSGNAGAGAAIGAVSGGIGGAVIGDQNQRRERERYYDRGYSSYDRGYSGSGGYCDR